MARGVLVQDRCKQVQDRCVVIGDCDGPPPPPPPHECCADVVAFPVPGNEPCDDGLGSLSRCECLISTSLEAARLSVDATYVSRDIEDLSYSSSYSTETSAIDVFFADCWCRRFVQIPRDIFVLNDDDKWDSRGGGGWNFHRTDGDTFLQQSDNTCTFLTAPPLRTIPAPNFQASITHSWRFPGEVTMGRSTTFLFMYAMEQQRGGLYMVGRYLACCDVTCSGTIAVDVVRCDRGIPTGLRFHGNPRMRVSSGSSQPTVADVAYEIDITFKILSDLVVCPDADFCDRRPPPVIDVGGIQVGGTPGGGAAPGGCAGCGDGLRVGMHPSEIDRILAE